MALVHPDMLTSLAAFYPKTCTFTLRAASVDAHGVPNGAQGDVAGLVNLSCSVNQPARSSAPQEVRRPDLTVVTDTRRIALGGYYPLVTDAMQCVVSDSGTYNVLSVHHDAQGVSTWITAEQVTT